MVYKFKFKWTEDNMEDVFEVNGKNEMLLNKKSIIENPNQELISIEKCYRDGRLVDIF